MYADKRSGTMKNTNWPPVRGAGGAPVLSNLRHFQNDGECPVEPPVGKCDHLTYSIRPSVRRMSDGASVAVKWLLVSNR